MHMPYSDGTPLTKVEDALSYVCYFIFVWWIWVAQVAYNVRFRQADALHKIWARISFFFLLPGMLISVCNRFLHS
jgi:hypothetical protein